MLDKVIITGERGFIGNKIREKLLSKVGKFDVDMLSVRDDNWKKADFSGVNVIIHTAGIVHNSDTRDWESYERINVNLTTELAEKAKRENVGFFVFLSSMAVYGVEKKLKPNYIDTNTLLRPKSGYGKSKLMAEDRLFILQDESFQIAVIRPPIVYGRGCSGNYFNKLSAVERWLPVIPEAYVNVKQGFLCIDNLTELIELIIENRASGYYMPQDEETICASELLSIISKINGKTKKRDRLTGTLVKCSKWLPQIKKAWGGVAYDCSMTMSFDGNYRIKTLRDGIREMLHEG